MIGQLLTGRYLILEKLGAGGFSETYLARDKYLPHHPLCVVKCFKLSTKQSITSDAALQLFENEAVLLGTLGQQHPQIPTLLAYCHEQQQPYLVQEYIEGESLGRWLARGERLSSRTAIALLLELLPLLDYIHTHGVVHRDIKPNHLIRRRHNNQLVLIDFGAACLLPESAATADSSHEEYHLAIGTPGYMPDEQKSGQCQINSDLYAAGMLVIHLLTGIHPRQFVGPDPVSGELNWRSYLTEHNLEPGLIEIINRMIRIKTGDRYQQATEVIADLQSIQGSRRPWQGLTQLNWRKSMRRLTIPASAVLLVGLVGGTYMQAQSRQAEPLLSHLGHFLSSSKLRLAKLSAVSIPTDVVAMQIAPSNQIFVTIGADQALRLWSLPDAALLKAVPTDTPVMTVSFSADSTILATGHADGAVQLWSIPSGQRLRILKGHQSQITAIALHPDGKTLVSSSQDGQIYQWDLLTGKSLQALKVAGVRITAIAYGTIANTLVSASSDHHIQLWDLTTGERYHTFAGHDRDITRLHVVAEHTLLSFGRDRGLVWNLQRQTLVAALPNDSANSTSTSLDNQKVMSVHPDGSIHVWNYQGKRLLSRNKNLSGHRIAAVSDDHRYIITWDPHQHLTIWELTLKLS